MNKRIGLILLLILVFTLFIKADVAPDSGKTYVTNALSIEAEEDFADYRFFLQSPIDLEEIVVKKGEKVKFSEGRGGAKNYVTLIAVPKKNLLEFGVSQFGKGEDYISPELLNKIIQEGKVAGIIKLVSHNFRREVPESYKNSPFSTDYKLIKDATNRVSLIKIRQSGGSGGAIDFSIYGTTKSFTIPGYIILVGFPTAAIVILGIWFFRRKGRKLG